MTDFRTWLQETQQTLPAAPPPPFDLATVVQQFTALRQEVNLQTRAGRTQLEQGNAAIDLLRQAHEALEQQQTRLQQYNQQEQDELLRPLLKALVDAHDALALARKEVRRKLDQLDDQPMPMEARANAPAPDVEVRLPFWARWLGLGATIDRQLTPLRAWQQAQRETETVPLMETYLTPQDPLARWHGILDALLVGYEMSLQRLERAMQHQGLETIACAGLPFDPETMEVVEVVREEGRAGTEVVEVVRNGYWWKERLFRYAQVRVAKP